MIKNDSKKNLTKIVKQLETKQDKKEINKQIIR